MAGKVIFHLPEGYLNRYRNAKHLALYPQVEDALLRRGGQVEIASRLAKLRPGESRKDDGNLHIVENGRVQGPGFLNAALAYLPGFWHLDPLGVLADSSLTQRVFDPAQVDRDAAQVFYDMLCRDFAQARKARYQQASATTEVPKGCIAVFLQGPMPQRRGQAHVGYAEMLRAVVLGSAGRPVLAKAHPLQKEIGQAVIAQIQAEGLPVTESTANVHDLLAAAAVSVSVNSAAAIEGFLHATPAILFGRSDYAQMVETVADVAEFPAAMARALATSRDYPLWFHWYFNQNCLNLNAPDFETRLFQIFAASGYDAARLGLR